jgi:hypothetical protein
VAHSSPPILDHPEVNHVYPQPRRFLWYLAFIVLFLFVLKSPVLAGHLVRQSGDLLSDAAGALSKLARSL